MIFGHRLGWCEGLEFKPHHREHGESNGTVATGCSGTRCHQHSIAAKLYQAPRQQRLYQVPSSQVRQLAVAAWERGTVFAAYGVDGTCVPEQPVASVPLLSLCSL